MSAFARTPKSPRNSSAHSMSLPKWPEVGSGWIVGAEDAGSTHASSNHRCVTRLATDGGENALRDVHAVDVVGRGFFAHQNYRRFLRRFDGVVRGERHAADCGAGGGGDAVGELRESLQSLDVEDGVQHLIELCGGDAQHGLALPEEFFFHHFDPDPDGALTAALAFPG